MSDVPKVQRCAGGYLIYTTCSWKRVGSYRIYSTLDGPEGEEWGDIAMVIVIDKEEVENVPENLEDFFDKFPSIGRANLELTDREHVSMWRDQVLFIRQRQQATSDFRENPKVRWIGSILFTRSNNQL